MSVMKKIKAALGPTTKDRLIYENGVLLGQNAALSAECIMLRGKVDALQAEVDAARAGAHKKPGNCKHCGRAKVDHFYYTARCKPNGGVTFEAAQ